MNEILEHEALLKDKLTKLKDILQLTETNMVDPEDIEGYVNYVNFVEDEKRIFQNVLDLDEKIKLLNIVDAKRSDASIQLEKDIRAVCLLISELSEQNLEKANMLLDNVRGEICSVKKQKKVNTYGSYLNLSSGGSFDTTK